MDRTTVSPRRPPAAAAPGRLLVQTQNLHAQPRFSYVETPPQTSRPVFRQFSSPTNSSIADTPRSSITEQYLSMAGDGDRSSYPDEKPQRVGSPYNFPAPQQIHPANFAPYAEEPVRTATPAAPHQLATLSPRLHSPSWEHNGPVRRQTTPVYGPDSYQRHPIPLPGPDSDRKQEMPTFSPPPRNPTYNPRSLSGPNIVPENHQPGQVSHPNLAVDPQWRHGMYELDGLCCLGIFCPCVVYGKTQYRLSQKAQKKEATDLLGYKAVNGSCGLLAVACGFQWLCSSIQRTRTRRLYKINGSFEDDCAKSLCCCCCVLAQNEREIRDREDLIRRQAGPANGPYVSPPTMVYEPPPR